MNTPLAKVIEEYSKTSYDYQPLITWHLAHGIVFSDFECFAMGYSCLRSSPETPVLREQSDTLFVTVFAGDMRKGLAQYACEYDFIAFQREFKGSKRVRVYPMMEFFKKLQIAYGI